MLDILRVYPAVIDDIIELLPIFLRKTTDADALISGLWILGAFPNKCDESPYYVETVINEYEGLNSSQLKIQVSNCFKIVTNNNFTTILGKSSRSPENAGKITGGDDKRHLKSSRGGPGHILL